jgi:hypothetical protein
MFGTHEEVNIYIQTPLLFSKTNDCESESENENSVRNGNNHVRLSCIYLTGPTVGQLESCLYYITSIQPQSYMTVC